MTWNRNRLNAALLVLVGGLIAVFALGRPAPDPGRPLTALVPEHIEEIRLLRLPATGIALTRREGEWWMTRPYRVRADPAHARALSRIAAAPSLKRMAVPNQRLGEFGLAPPWGSLRLDQVQLRFGTTEPVHHRRYVATSDHVHLIEDNAIHLLLGTPETFVSRQLIPAGASILALAGPNFRVERTASGEWRSSGELPAGFRAEPLIEAWQRARAQEVVAAPQATATGQIRIRLQATPEPLIFTRVADAPGLLVREGLNLAFRMAPDFDGLPQRPEPEG